MIQQALWIAPPGADDFHPCHFRAEKTFELDSVPQRITAQIACDSYYLLEINGLRVGRGPARGSVSRIFYDEYEVARFLRKGTNTVSVLGCCMNYPAQASLPVTSALRFALGDLLLTDTSWEMSICKDEWPSNGPLYCPQIGYAEVQNLNYEKKDPAVPCIAVAKDSPLWRKELVKRDIPEVLETANLPVDVPAAAFVPPCDLEDLEFAGLSTAEPHFPLPPEAQSALYALAGGGENNVTLPVPPEAGGVTLVVDFGKEVSGFAEIEVTTSDPGIVLDVAYEEELFRNDRLRADHTHTNPDYKFADRFILRSGRQSAGTRLMDRGFRMIQLTFRNVKSPVTLHKVTAIDRRYPFAKRGQFFCGDYQLNRLWETAQETLSACTTDIFTDCPWRERLFYSNDFLIENRTCMKMFGDLRVCKRGFRLIFSSNRSDAMFTSCAPSSAPEVMEKGKTDFHVILSGELMLNTALKEYYMHSGEKAFVKECLPHLRKMLEAFEGWLDDKNILNPPVEYWNFFDWSFELNGMTFSGKRTSLLNFLYIIGAKDFNYLAAETGEKPFCSEEKLDAILKQTIAVFYSPDEKCFLNTLDDPAATTEWLTLLGVARENLKVVNTSSLAHAMGFLAGADSCYCTALLDEKLLVPELYYGIFVLDAMEKLGKHKEALDYIRRHWGSMLDSGTPTLWENGVHKKGKAGFGGSASLCHGFSTAPAAYLQSAVLGVKPLEPGFKLFSFDPQYPELKFAQGLVPTPRGAIRCRWSVEGNRIKAALTVPPECTAKTPAGIFPAGAHELEWEF